MSEIRAIQPLGEQIIIRTIPQNSIGSIIVPDSAKGITMMGDKGAQDAVHFVEAEVVAVGPGKHGKGDPGLAHALLIALQFSHAGVDRDRIDLAGFEQRAKLANNNRIPIEVKPGDRILYHPSVQKFDREITNLMNGDGEQGAKYFIIREESVLAVIENEDA